MTVTCHVSLASMVGERWLLGRRAWEPDPLNLKRIDLLGVGLREAHLAKHTRRVRRVRRVPDPAEILTAHRPPV